LRDKFIPTYRHSYWRFVFRSMLGTPPSTTSPTVRVCPERRQRIVWVGRDCIFALPCSRAGRGQRTAGEPLPRSTNDRTAPIQHVRPILPECIWPCASSLDRGGANFEFKQNWSQHEQMIVERSALQSTVGSVACSRRHTAVANALDKIRNSLDPILRLERSTATKD
jgi:hypothetical protein